MYIGKFKQVLSDGETVVSVQADDGAGNSFTLDPNTYITSGGYPPIESLPTQYEYKT